MTCKHGFPEPNEMMWQGKKILRCNECEIERLRQRVAELNEETREQDLRHTDLLVRYAERGERMKEMWREYENGPTKAFRMKVCDWFDETGEPL